MSDFYEKELSAKLVEKALGIERYLKIMEMVKNPSVNLADDEDFKKTFNYFYRVRRNETWRIKYYDYFEEHKNESAITFENILRYLNKIDEKTEISFASKMLASINNEMPIWDQFVVKYFNIKMNTLEGDNHLEQAVRKYNKLCDIYNSLIKSSIAKKYETIFDNITSSKYHSISLVKKIDFLIWATEGQLPRHSK
ncbi:formate dehydrogenase maturation protein FdhE [Lachnospiraceae bacterium PFB1-21]